MLGAWAVRREVRRVEEMSNHLLHELGVGLAGQGSGVETSSALPTTCRSRRAQCGVGGGSMIACDFSVIKHGTWSEPVEGRAVSNEVTRWEAVDSQRLSPKRKASKWYPTGNEYTPQGC